MWSPFLRFRPLFRSVPRPHGSLNLRQQFAPIWHPFTCRPGYSRTVHQSQLVANPQIGQFVPFFRIWRHRYNHPYPPFRIGGCQSPHLTQGLDQPFGWFRWSSLIAVLVDLQRSFLWLLVQVEQRVSPLHSVLLILLMLIVVRVVLLHRVDLSRFAVPGPFHARIGSRQCCVGL